MATAPDPGSYAEETGARKFLRMRVKDRTLDLVMDLTMKERFVVRTATGLPIEGFLPAESEREFGVDSLFVLWWIARRQNGEPRLSIAEAEDDWPTEFGEDDFEATEIDLDDEDPEDDSPES